MKKISLLFICFLMLQNLFAQDLCVATYNIRNKNSRDSVNGNEWQKRCAVLCSQINYEQPDVLGTQEVLHSQLIDMLNALDGYGYLGVGREDGKQSGEYAAVFYKKDRIELEDSGHFWLNEQTDVPLKGWDAACVRICTWGRFREKQSGKIFYMFNLHMDHVGVEARQKSSELVVRKIKETAKDNPAVLTGDFNVDQTDGIYTIFTQSQLLSDCYTLARLKFITNGTFNNFNSDVTTSSRIDHIFVTKHFYVDRYAVLTDGYWDKSYADDNEKAVDAPKEIQFKKSKRRLPSDHYPVFARLRFNP